MITLSISEAIVLTGVVVLVSVYAGSIVQKKSLFTRPFDFITLSVIALSCLAACMMSDLRYWACVVIAGYITGYVLAGRAVPLFYQYLDPDTASNRLDYWIIYKIKGQTYIADQSNKEFIKRLLGIHHKLYSDVPIKAGWKVDVHVPRKRKRIIADAINITEIKESEETKKLWWKINVKEYTTTVTLADGSATSNADLVRTYSTVKQLRKRVLRLTSENHRLKNEESDKTASLLFDYTFPNSSELTQKDLDEIAKDHQKKKVAE